MKIHSADLARLLRESSIPEHETDDILHADEKSALAAEHYAKGRAGAPERFGIAPGFREIGWGRIFYEIGEDGTLATVDADDRVYYHAPRVVQISAVDPWDGDAATWDNTALRAVLDPEGS